MACLLLKLQGNNDCFLIGFEMNKLQTDILEKGFKVTPQRLAILRYLKENRVHPTAEKIYSEITKEYPAISLTTVYKTLASFVEAGMVKELDIDPHKMRFDICTEDHNHFHCRVCDNVYDVDCDGSTITGDLNSSTKIEGHKVDTVDIHLKGVCRYCEAVSS